MQAFRLLGRWQQRADFVNLHLVAHISQYHTIVHKKFLDWLVCWLIDCLVDWLMTEWLIVSVHPYWPVWREGSLRGHAMVGWRREAGVWTELLVVGHHVPLLTTVPGLPHLLHLPAGVLHLFLLLKMTKDCDYSRNTGIWTAPEDSLRMRYKPYIWEKTIIDYHHYGTNINHKQDM